MQEIVLWVYKTSLRFEYFLQDVFSWQDAKLTLKAMILTLNVFLISFFLGDSLFLWIVSNTVLLWPLAHRKFGKQIDQGLEQLNSKIDSAVYQIPFVKKLEQSRSKQLDNKKT